MKFVPHVLKLGILLWLIAVSGGCTNATLVSKEEPTKAIQGPVIDHEIPDDPRSCFA